MIANIAITPESFMFFDNPFLKPVLPTMSNCDPYSLPITYSALNFLKFK